MEKDRSSKIIAIAALFIAVIGLSVGFAALNASLEISNTSASVSNSSENLNVLFSTNQNSSGTEEDVKLENIQKTENGGTATLAPDAVMTGTSISGLSATFTAPGQSVSYTIYAHNASTVYAYLNSITLGNVDGEETNKICTANTGTDEASVSRACEGISLSVKVGAETATTASIADINNHGLDKGANEPIVITIDYAENSYTADGDFSVDFGNIQLLYKSVD